MKTVPQRPSISSAPTVSAYRPTAKRSTSSTTVRPAYRYPVLSPGKIGKGERIAYTPRPRRHDA